MIFLLALASTLKEEEDLEREGRPLTEDLSKLKGAGLRFTDAMTEAAIFAIAASLAFAAF